MAKDLVIGNGRYERWRLPEEYNLESLKSALDEAFIKSSYVWIAVELDENPPRLGDLILNGRVVPFADRVRLATTVNRRGGLSDACRKG